MDRYTEYRESGAEWLGEIPRDWPMLFLSQVATQVKNKNTELGEQNLLSLSYGRIKRKPIDTNGGLLPASFDGYNIIEKNDIVLRLTDLQNDHTSLRVGLSPERGIITSAYVTVRPRDEDSASYLYYVLHTFDIRKGLYGMGSGVRQGLNYDEIKKIQIPFPSKTEQHRIASYLDDKVDQIDTLIAEAKASIEEYKAWKASIIYEAVTKGLDPNVEMKDSGVEWIGGIPKHWNATKLKHYIDILPGYAFSSDDFSNEGIPLLRGINVAPDSIRWDDVVYWNKELPNYLKPFMLQVGDVVVGLDRPWISSGTRIAIIQEKDLPALLLQRVCRIRTNSQLDIRLVKYWIESDSFQKSLSTETTGISVPHISTGQIEDFRVAVPPVNEQKEICQHLETKCTIINDIISEKESLISDLEAYKKSLIFEVVTGKRKVV